MDPWLDTTLAGMNHGIRRRDSEQLLIYVNMPCCGVVSGSRMLFSVGEVTRLLHQHPKSAIACVLLPNRANVQDPWLRLV